MTVGQCGDFGRGRGFGGGWEWRVSALVARGFLRKVA